jgi:hypothetical protein
VTEARAFQWEVPAGQGTHWEEVGGAEAAFDWEIGEVGEGEGGGDGGDEVSIRLRLGFPQRIEA